MDASIARLFTASLQPDTFGVALAVGGLYATWLWHGARRTARWLEQTPKPLDTPRRRALNPCCPIPLPKIHFGVLAMLGAKFHAVATANPTRRIEDKTTFLHRVAGRWLTTAIVLSVLSTATLLGR